MATQVEPELVTEAPPAPVEEPVAVESAPAATDSSADATPSVTGQPRGPDGKFLPKTGEQPPAEAEAPPTEPPDAAAEPPVDAAAAPLSTEPATTADPFALATPWSMKVDGQHVVLDGAVVLPGKGVLFPEQHMDVVRQIIARGIQYGQERPRFQEEQRRWKSEAAAEKAQLSVVGEVAAKIFAAQNEDELATVILDLWQNKDRLQWEAQKRKEQAELAAQRQALAPTQEQQQHETDVRLGESVEDAIAQAKAMPWAAGLQAQDWQALGKVIEPIRRSFIVQVSEDVPEAGLKQGDLAFNTDLFFRFMEQQAGLVTAERTRLAEEKKKDAANRRAAATNTAALRPSVQAPPSVSSAEKPAPAGPGSGPVFTSREEYDAWIRGGR